MREIESRIVGFGDNGIVRLRVTWEIRNGFLLRHLMGLPKSSEMTAMYQGNGKVWRVVGNDDRCGSMLESQLTAICARLTAHDGEDGR